MAGLDLVARKSLERGSEASILISESLLKMAERTEDDEWSWKRIMEQFCIKNAEGLFHKYQARLQHTLFMLALMLNVICGSIALIVLWIKSLAHSDDLNVTVAVRGAAVAASLALYIIAYRESWFLSAEVRLGVSCLVLIVTAGSEMGGSIHQLAKGHSPGTRFTAYPLLVTTVLLPFPRLYQAMIATVILTILALTLDGLAYRVSGILSLAQMSADVVFHVTLGLIGLYIRFLMEFTNRKAFLDRREFFENKFHLQYEKEQEEQLLLSVLPRHISVQVRDGIRDVIRRLDQAPVPQRPFTELFVEKHRNVSILYADIVNSVALTASLSVSDLVETLNELFGRFDDCAEKNFCLRIKLLGDCYYCVSGIPDSDPLHADHCVQMGLDMIEITRSFREESHLNVDMRIGVHSGNVLSGLLGLRKWQFDIWSRDVTIASRMEQTGQPGCVHVTRATKDLLQCKYQTETGHGHLRDAYLAKANMETFLIQQVKKNQMKRDSVYNSASPDKTPNYIRRQSVQQHSKLHRKQSAVVEVLSSRRRTVLGFSLLQFRQMVSQVNQFMESAIHAMALSKKDQWFKSEGIQPLLLTFRQRPLEIPYLKQGDPLYKYSLLGVFVVCSAITAISALTKSRPSYFSIACSATFVMIFASLLCSWSPYIWSKVKKSGDYVFLRRFRSLIGSVVVRMLLCVFISLLMIISAMMGMEGCLTGDRKQSLIVTGNMTSEEPLVLACHQPWYFTWCAVLVMTSVSIFLRIHFLLKLAINGSMLALFVAFVSLHTDVFSKSYLSDWLDMPPGIDQCWCLAVTWFTLHILDRQVEYIGRLDYLWKRKLHMEQEEAYTMALVNRTLLQNILPVHVAQYYLNKDNMHFDLDQYHEDYSSVAVMFASIPNYMDFYSESLLNDEGRKCLQVLHEIICDFDKLLYEPSFLKIEKIKTFGSTYMAAAGLQPGRNSSRTSYDSVRPDDDPVQNVLLLMKFAVAMVETLHELNRNCWQDFRLRIGIAVGPVMAGVVGATKPQYDIWGDTVNLASRMDSTGITGAIQVTEAVASLLEENSKYDLQCRGDVFIKGKGWMTTYILYPPEITRL